MANSWTIWQLSKMRQKEILKEAERSRLLSQGGSNRGKSYLDFSTLLNKLGRLLVSWGFFLKKRYGLD